jgi:signal transduction histidine kinase
MRPDPGPIFFMADFSNPLPDPLEAARRRHGFSAPEDLEALDQLVALAAQAQGTAASLRLGDRGGVWYETAAGRASGSWTERSLALEGTDVEGLLRVAGPVPDPLLDRAARLILELLRLRRLGAERRRQPRGPEGASFVPGVVHELRNFLFAMGAGLDAFEARFGGLGEEAAHTDALRRNLGRFQGFLEELGEYGNPGSLVFECLPVMPVLAQAIRLAEPTLLGRDLQIHFQPIERPLFERMARPALESTLRRLVELSALEAQVGGTIVLGTALIEDPGRPWLEISIQGSPGLDRDLDPGRLFEPFHYRNKDMSRLGPAIARRLVEAHGGQLAATLEPDGLMLRVMLPVWMEAQP